MDVEDLVRTLRAKGHSHIYGDGEEDYDVYKLWILCERLPAEEVAFDELGPKLEHACWGEGLSPKMVLEARGLEYVPHWRRIVEADLSYPLLVTKKGSHVVDGMHRLSRYSLEGGARVLIRRVPSEVMSLAVLTK